MDTTLLSILEASLQQGIWAALYIYLFFRMLKQNEVRETQYQSMINNLSTKIEQGVINIQSRLETIENALPGKENKTK